jgi:hypothetical protein
MPAMMQKYPEDCNYCNLYRNKIVPLLSIITGTDATICAAVVVV